MRISTLFWHLKRLNVTFTYIRWDGMGCDNLGVFSIYQAPAGVCRAGDKAYTALLAHCLNW